jgi:cell division protein YceG involved in septum cleavage
MAMIQKILIRGILGLVLVLCILATAGISILLESKEFVFNQVIEKPTQIIDTNPFPVSVDAANQTIAEEDLLSNHNYETLAYIPKKETWQSKIVALFGDKEWYQNLASPVSRIIVIWPGERKEEIVKSTGDILHWNAAERTEFLTLITEAEPLLPEGKFYPGQYVAHKDATPVEVSALITEKFTTDVLARYTDEVSEKVPLEDALIIASLLEREASDFENMREVSGVIWNRLFIDMPLQLDATLQYVRGGKANEKRWWPVPKPADKYLKSPFNTYTNKGLPPSAISNPSAAAILAALNPRPTDCIYYFHDKRQGYHCSVTYEEHVRKLKQQYGRGK